MAGHYLNRIFFPNSQLVPGRHECGVEGIPEA